MSEAGKSRVPQLAINNEWRFDEFCFTLVIVILTVAWIFVTYGRSSFYQCRKLRLKRRRDFGPLRFPGMLPDQFRNRMDTCSHTLCNTLQKAALKFSKYFLHGVMGVLICFHPFKQFFLNEKKMKTVTTHVAERIHRYRLKGKPSLTDLNEKSDHLGVTANPTTYLLPPHTLPPPYPPDPPPRTPQ